ncbi:MAG: hypothetical protein J6562_03915 [Candidatus Schmidhempelia sp.]|nr:hypothetical protein [Candidatus Schmidhempelia sp.]
MPNNNENIKTYNVFSAQTTQIKNGEVAIKNVVLKNMPKPLFVIFTYGGTGASAFLRAAEHKKQRLKIKYPDAEIRIIRGFKDRSQFKTEWTKLYNELTKSTNKYALWQIHYFGHGKHDALNFIDSKYIYFNQNDNMEILPWHPNQGIFVLHSCRGGAYEDTDNVIQIKQQNCLAKTISQQQKTRCLGQVTYANNAADMVKFYDNLTITDMPYPSTPIIYQISPEKYVAQFKYRPQRYINNIALKSVSGVLWGYALRTGKTYTKTLNLKDKYEKALTEQGIINPIYPIYEEIKKLASNNQILPCRVFNKGVLEARIVKADVFNQNDLEYI